MNKLDLRFHHLALAVKQSEKAEIFLTAMGYTCSKKVYDPEQNVNLQLYQSTTSPAFEVVLPGRGEGPLTPLFKRGNEIIYHTCYEVTDIEASLQNIKDTGLRALQIAPRTPAVLFGGRKVSFYQVLGFGLIELLEP